MTTRLAVSKMHGARNDFVVVDARGDRRLLEELPLVAPAICDRHTGIGADGVLIVGDSLHAHVAMRVINADGSEAEMCGNGIRCVARYLDEHGEGGELAIDTLAGIISTSVIERGETYGVRVDMGVPKIREVALDVGDATVVDTGNPHVVLFGADMPDDALVSLGERLQHDPHFPGGTNLHIARVLGGHEMIVRHYERGAGLTMACGTGAVACAVAAIARTLVASPVRVHVPGGELQIELDASGRAFMTGPAVHVFDTKLDLRLMERA